ncbi:MAG TPA: hypothetical protein VIS48_10030 [Candidatus Kryptonia bacterium]
MKITLYRTFPPHIQKFVRALYSLVPFQLRMGRGYRQTMKLIRAQEFWNRKQIKEWQLANLKKIVSYAFESVPGYRQIYREAGVSPSELNTLEDIRHFPFVSKELLRDNLREFTSDRIPKWKLLYRTTGGSTGIPFGFNILQADIEREAAFLHNAWARAGWQRGEMSALLRGAFVGSEKEIWEYDPFLKDLRLSSYFLNARTYSRFLEILSLKKPVHLQAYPSAATIFADLVLRNNDAGKLRFKLLLLGSENLYDWQKTKIMAAFPESRIFSWYGHAEQVLFAPMCEHSGNLHLDPFYGFAEILDRQDKETEAGATGELVGTSFWNLATPFIRYRTMDMARKGALECSECGRNYQLLSSIDGRLQELIVTKSGRFISMTALNMHSNVFDNVKQFQFRQTQAGKVTFNIVKNINYSNHDAENIRKELLKKLGTDVDLELAYVNKIEIPQSGKFRFLIQELPVAYGDHARH